MVTDPERIEFNQRMVINRAHILQAPCEFQLLSSNRMALVGGRMTAKVPDEATGYAVDTPASTVVACRTEFGVLVGTKGESEVYVFAGEVGLSQSRGGRDTRCQMLQTGEAASVDRAGGVRLDTMTDRPRLFVQNLPPGDLFGIPGRRLDLADIFRGGASGFGTGRSDSVICTGSGQFVWRGQWLDDEWRCAFVPVPLHDLLDDDFKESDSVVMRLRGLEPGTYLITTYHHDPLEESKDSDGTISITVTDAKGPRVAARRFWQSWGPNPKVVACATFAFESDGRDVVLVFEDNDDAMHNEAHLNGFDLDALEIAGARRVEEAGAMWFVPRPELEGHVFGTRAHPAIYMHANIGVTFELESIRGALFGARVVAFQAQCGLMSPLPEPVGRASRAGFWVLVDGQVRFRHIEEQPGVRTPVNVELSDHDQFLTLVTTDGGDGHESDLCFFGDPALELESAR